MKAIGTIIRQEWKAKPILWRKNWENWEFINNMHIPALLKESTEFLNPKSGDVILDATINGGGHSEEILKLIGEKGRLVGIDQDGEVLNKLKEKWKAGQNILLARDNFRNLDKVLESLTIGAKRTWPMSSGNTAKKDSAEESPKISFEKEKRKSLRRRENWLTP